MRTRQMVMVGFAALAALTAVAAASSENREAFGESWRRLTDDPGQACFDFEKLRMKDPFSARFVSYKEDVDSPHSVTVIYYAKNGYGAYLKGEALCSLSQGKVNKTLTEIIRASQASRMESARLQRQIDCTSRQSSLLLKGRSVQDAKREADC